LSFDIKNLYKYSFENKIFIENSNKCACYFCLSIFEPKEIKEWTDSGETAICPRCQVDSVLADSTIEISEELLTQANKHWFGGNFFKKGK
jgi:hypothetical protein